MNFAEPFVSLYRFAMSYPPKQGDNWYDGNDLAKQDRFVLDLVKQIQFQVESPEVLTSLEKSKRWYDIWEEVRGQNFTELRYAEAEERLLNLVAMKRNLDLYELPPLTSFDLTLVKLVDALQPHLEREQLELKDLSEYHLGFGRTLMILTSLLEASGIRYDQAKVLLKAAYEAGPLAALQDVMFDNAELFNEASGDELEGILDEVMKANEKACDEIRGGKDKAIGFLVGMVMKKHKADPAMVKDRLFKKIKGSQ